jgi:hypothetical protein
MNAKITKETLAAIENQLKKHAAPTVQWCMQHDREAAGGKCNAESDSQCNIQHFYLGESEG